MKPLSPEAEALIYHINRDLHEALQGFVGQTITDATKLRIQQIISDKLKRWSEGILTDQEIGRWVEFVADPENNCLHMRLKDPENAPDWALRLFSHFGLNNADER